MQPRGPHYDIGTVGTIYIDEGIYLLQNLIEQLGSAAALQLWDEV